MIGTSTRPRGLVAIFLVLTFFVLQGITLPNAAAAVDIYYFSPDSPQSNLGGLKREMETFLDRADFSANFQPFAHYVDFDQTVREKRPPFLLLPAWYYRLYGEKLGLRPLLTPLHNGVPTYRKVLLVRKGAKITFANIGNQSLAMTTMGPEDQRTLNSILFASRGADAKNLNIITVPKDADALFALALGHVDMALVGKQSMELIGSVNPRIIAAVAPLAESAPIPGPILCYAADKVPAAMAEELKRLMQQSQSDHNVMDILQIDGWVAVHE